MDYPVRGADRWLDPTPRVGRPSRDDEPSVVCDACGEWTPGAHCECEPCSGCGEPVTPGDSCAKCGAEVTP